MSKIIGIKCNGCESVMMFTVPIDATFGEIEGRADTEQRDHVNIGECSEARLARLVAKANNIISGDFSQVGRRHGG